MKWLKSAKVFIFLEILCGALGVPGEQTGKTFDLTYFEFMEEKKIHQS